MSFGSSLLSHLSDYLVLIDGLFESLGSSYAGSGATLTICDKIIRKEELMQIDVDQIIQQQQQQRQLQQLQQQITNIDTTIIQFACKLQTFEQQLHQQTTGIKHQRYTTSANSLSLSLSSSLTSPSPSPSLSPSAPSSSVRSICLLSEKVGLMSFAPADFIERKGLVLSRPPAPLEAQMGNSILHTSIQQLIQMAKQQKMQQNEMTTTGNEQITATETATAIATATGGATSYDSITNSNANANANSTIPALNSFRPLPTASSSLPSFSDLDSFSSSAPRAETTAFSTPRSVSAASTSTSTSASAFVMTPAVSSAALELDLHMESESENESESDESD